MYVYVTLPFKDRMFLVIALENVDDIGKYLCYNLLHSDSNKAQKELNQNVNRKMFRITVDYLGGNLTSNIEINVPLNRRPMCLLHQPMAVLMFRDHVITGQKNLTINIALVPVCWYNL